MKTIRKKYLINASLGKVWESLINPKIIEAWGAGPVEMTDEEGEEFNLWGGDIHGRNTEVIPDKKLAQDWYGGDWEKPSKVIFTLKPVGKSTEIFLLHEGIPDGEAKKIDEGWDDYYLGPLKEYLEKDYSA